ncbi:MAG: LPS export ABC transporter permease LptF [Arsenophonus sp.]
MIIIRYLIKETLKNQVAIFFILILIFFSQKTINILNSTIKGNIPSNLVLPLLWLGIPEMAQLIFPLSLFLGLLMTYSKLYINSEITVMYACGLSKQILIITALILSLFTIIISVINVDLVLPSSAKYQEQTLSNEKNNPSLDNIVEGKFKTTKDKNIVLYIRDVTGKNFTDIFMAQLVPINNQPPSIVIAESGYIRKDENGNKIVILDKGIRYESEILLRNFRITEFKNYQAIINHKDIIIKNNKIEQKDMLQLWRSIDIKSKLEFHWRLTLVISTLIMALLVVPLSHVNPRHGRVLNMLLPILLYMIFFLLQSMFHSNVKKYKFDPRIMIWLVNGIFFLLAIILNIWDTLSMRILRAKFYKKIIRCFIY